MEYPTSGNERLWATLAYALFCFPVAAPLLIFLVMRGSRFVAFHALQALFVQLGLVLMGFVVPLIAGMLGMLGPLALLNIPLGIIAWAICVGAVIFKIIAAINANAGRWYRIPYVWPYAERFA